MRRAKYILCTLTTLCTVILSGQSRSQLRDMFVSAEGDMLYEDYAEALPKYLNLLKIYPENFNFYYRIGQCYLNTPGEKEKSIPFLETAVDHIDRDYRKGRFNETDAPYDALYLLANAYRIDNDLDKAVETYARFMKEVDTEVYDTTLVRFQMQTCLNAREMMKKPVFVVEKNLGNTINGRFSEYDPVMSSDENSLLFTRGLQFYDAVFWSTKTDGQWSEPVNLTPQLGVDQDYYTASLSADGKTLLLYRIDTYDGNIYLSRLEGDRWSHVEKLNGNINTKYWESHATMTRDGSKIYFTSNRKESLGGLDIFVSVRDSTGDWGPAVNLGPLINTGYDEETPFLANNDRTLFFSSRGHYNIGGYDIFRSDPDENGEWGVSVNLGYPVNSTDDDLFFMPLEKGDRGLIAKYSPDGYGRMDIFSYEIYSDRNRRNLFVTGKAGIKNLLNDFLQPVNVKAVNNADPGQEFTVQTNPLNGLYSLRLPQGSYDFTFSSDDALTLSQNYDMPLTLNSDTIRMNTVSLESTDSLAFLRVMADSLVKVTGPDPVSIDLLTEPMSLLNIQIVSPDSAIITEHHQISDTVYTFAFLPEKGESLVTFSLTDRFGNDTAASVAVIRTDRARRSVPLYRDIIRPPQTARQTEDTTRYAEKALQDSAAPVVSETESTTGEGGGKKCWLLWLIIPATLIVFFIIWRDRKRKRKEKE